MEVLAPVEIPKDLKNRKGVIILSNDFLYGDSKTNELKEIFSNIVVFDSDIHLSFYLGGMINVYICYCKDFNTVGENEIIPEYISQFDELNENEFKYTGMKQIT